MKQIPPLFLRVGYWKHVDEEIARIFRELIFMPLMRVLSAPHPEFLNAESTPLLDALRDGTIWYEDGHFYGAFNARISAELRGIGALYHTKSRTWSLERSNLPPDIRRAQAAADSRYDALRRSFLTTLGDMNIDSIDQHAKLKDSYKRTIEWMNDDFKKSLRGITIAPDLTETQRDMIAAEWGTNLDLYIKKWAADEILSLRERVQAEAFQGRRAASLVKMVQDGYGVSQRKAQFLARQETSLLMSKFRESRYAEVGVKKYKWSTSHDERVRTDHRHLNGKIFSFDSPPVTNLRTGARNNPGEDFGCRCIAIALID